jgi:hypothetical protein
MEENSKNSHFSIKVVINDDMFFHTLAISRENSTEKGCLSTFRLTVSVRVWYTCFALLKGTGCESPAIP